jgi:hypothetical protein
MENTNLTTTTLKWLYDTARWARFIAILGFVFIGFMVVIGIFITPVLSYLNEELAASATSPQVSPVLLAIIYLVIAIVYFFPIYYLFQFSNGIIVAYKAKHEENLNASFHYLKKHFKFIGILMIISMAVYFIIFLIGIFAVVIG